VKPRFLLARLRRLACLEHGGIETRPNVENGLPAAAEEDVIGWADSGRAERLEDSRRDLAQSDGACLAVLRVARLDVHIRRD
jgi:hypothetical protein